VSVVIAVLCWGGTSVLVVGGLYCSSSTMDTCWFPASDFATWHSAAAEFHYHCTTDGRLGRQTRCIYCSDR